MNTDELNQILTLQLAVAWAGEGQSDPPRLAWWRTGMVDEFGGEDLLQRLAPRTWRWATLEAAREAARRVDRSGRERSNNADHLRSLFSLGFECDEQLDDRLRELKQQGAPPTEALPGLATLLPEWSQPAGSTSIPPITALGCSAPSTSIGSAPRAIPGSKC